MGNDALKTRTPISNAVNTILLNELKEISIATSIPISKLLDKAIALLLNDYRKTTN